jgi:RNA polymerase sigma factor (sigma-70 family)
MAAGQLVGVIRHLRSVARQHDGHQIGDAELLERFIARRDDGAFQLLVRRHGPMVLGVCKRVLGNKADAEDAFQATFLVLIRKATSIVPRTQVGNWLHGVAHKTALKARAMDRKRRVKERAAGMAQDPTAVRGRNLGNDTWESLLELLDGELNALPEKYRSPIILCDLEGLSYREAAARLRCPQGTLSGRLTRARALLARRIAHHGVPVTATALAALLARDISASIPRSLITWTTRAGSVFAAGNALTEGLVSSKVASLSEGVLKMLLLSKLKSVTGGLLLLAAVLAASWSWSATVSARAGEPGDDVAAQTEEASRASTLRKANGGTDSAEAEFVFRGASKGRKTVSLVVAGTSGPVLCLPVQEDIQVVVGGRRVELDDLDVGTRVVIRLDRTNRVIQDIRALQRPEKATILKSASELKELESPPIEEVLRALPRVPRGVPGVVEVFRDDIQVVTERLVRQVDPPRFFPLVGEAELHHNHWKCTVHYIDTVEASYPYPVRTKQPRTEVVYVDKDYLVPTK